MTAKEYLSQIKLLDEKIKQRKEQLFDLREKTTSLSQTLSPDKVQTSMSGDKMARMVEKYLDLQDQVMNMIWNFEQTKDIILSQIHELDDHRYVDLLYWKYIKYKRLEEICDIMKKSNGDPYSYDHIASLHGEALKSFSQKFKIF